jgi:ribonuclease BN (tRNA processing enzyme)
MCSTEGSPARAAYSYLADMRFPIWSASILAAELLGSACSQRTTMQPEYASVRPDSTGTTVVLLGTGMPRPDPQASGPATAIVVGKRVFLVDAGPGVERRLAAAHLPIGGVDALFITHLHSDHTLGYPDLIFTSWVMGRRHPFPVYGPPGIQQMTDHLIAAYKEDIEVRTEGLEHESPGGYRVDVHEIMPGVIYDSAGIRVTAIAVPHGSWRYAYGYRFDTPDRAVVISGDTRPSPALEGAASGADVLVHEVYSADELRRNPRRGTEQADWPRYMHEFHTSDVELGALAARASPKLLILSHIVRQDATDSSLMAGVRAGGFGGRVVVGHDLDRY